MRVRQFVDEGLGNSAHLVISDSHGVAALIDPLRDVDCYMDAARSEGVRITHVLETHIHNDFVSGSRELATLTGARVVASADAGLEFDHERVRDGDTLAIGDVQLTVLATPGHTPEHVSYLAQDTTRPAEPAVLFSGGSLLVGAVSRTDLLGHEHATGLAHQLYHSLHENGAWDTAGLPVERVPVLTMREVRQRLVEEAGEPLVVVDVRQAHEWAAGHIPQAELTEAGALPCAELHFSHEQLLAIHCGHGQRAATGLSVLEHRGYKNLALIAEGIDEWREAGGEVERGALSGPVPARLS